MARAARKTVSKISFDVSTKDRAIIRQIAERAVQELNVGRLDTLMDITATHCNGNPLRLADLLSANAFNFAHDIYGIARHLNRETGALMDFFSPRYSQREAA